MTLEVCRLVRLGKHWLIADNTSLQNIQFFASCGVKVSVWIPTQTARRNSYASCVSSFYQHTSSCLYEIFNIFQHRRREPFLPVFVYLYLFTDIFNRKSFARRYYYVESIVVAGNVIRDMIYTAGILPNQVVLHFDNGNPMTAITMLAILQALDAAPSFGRTAVSDYNSYSGPWNSNLHIHAGR